MSLISRNGKSHPPPPAAAPEEFAPPGHPRRIDQIAALTGQSIRQACENTGNTVMSLIAEAEGQLATLRHDAEQFVRTLQEVGHAHASRIETALASIRDVMTGISAERERVKTMIDYTPLAEAVSAPAFSAVTEALEGPPPPPTTGGAL
jgi:hypothetical protein